MYERLRVEDPKKFPKWSKLGVDSTDHYCIAARSAIGAFHESAIKEILVEI